MSSSIIALDGLALFGLAYRFYSKRIAEHVFGLDKVEGPTPAVLYRDDIDYVPTQKEILIGHHFSSIAGAAPIVGPAVAAIWGWLPAVIWIVFGVIFMGACHDFGVLVVSMKHKGHSIAQVAGELLGKRSKFLFLVVIFFLVWMVIAVFALVIANLFVSFPGSVIPVNFEIIVAVLMGYFINRKSGKLKIPSILAQIALTVMIVVGTYYPVSLKEVWGISPLMIWILFLLVYSFMASVLPVWALLQPRDFINSHQLILGLGLMVVGLFIVNPPVVAPAINPNPVGAPPWFPFLFITIACGAISGFHGLVSGGTSSKQIAHWSDARPVGYMSMLGEGLLALLATLAVTAGFESEALWHEHYSSWNAANGLAAKINAFVLGASKFVAGVGIPTSISQTFIAVFIISFAATSLDTACRIQRYIVGELGEGIGVPILKDRYLGSFIAVVTAFALMVTSEGGKGGLAIWPLFGTANQMLAGLSLLVICLYLIKEKRPPWAFLVPAIFLYVMTGISLGINVQGYLDGEKTLLLGLGILLGLVQVWVLIETVVALRKILNQNKI